MSLTNTTATPGTTLGSPTRTGDAVIKDEGGVGGWVWSDLSFLSTWTGNWAFVGNSGGATGNVGRVVALKASNGTSTQNRLEIRNRATSSPFRVDVAHVRSNVATVEGISDTTSVYSSTNQYLVWTSGTTTSGGGTLNIAYLLEDGTLNKVSGSFTSGDHTLSYFASAGAVNASAMVGINSPTAGEAVEVYEAVFAHTGASDLSTLTDDELIAIIRDPSLLGIHTEVEDIWCIMGDLVDATTEEREYLETIDKGGHASYKLKCPHTGEVSDAGTVISGTPWVMPYYTAAAKGEIFVNQNYRDSVNVSTANSSVGHLGIAAESNSNTVRYFRTLVDVETGRRLKQPIAGEPLSENSSGTTRAHFNNSGRDTHNNCTFIEVGGKLVGVYSPHHTVSSGFAEVFSLSVEDDSSGIPTWVRPTFGGSTVTQRATSYYQAFVTPDNKLFIDTRSESNLARRILHVVFDPSDNSVDHRFVTVSATSGGTDYKAPLALGYTQLSGSTYALFSQGFTSVSNNSVGLSGFIVDTSDITTDANYSLAGDGTVLDGLSGRPAVGSLDYDEAGFYIDDTNPGRALASQDEIVTAGPAVRGDRIATISARDIGNLDNSGDPTFTVWYLQVYLWDGTSYSLESERDITSLLTGAISTSDLEDKSLSQICSPIVPTGKAGCIFSIVEPDGTTMSNTVNVPYDSGPRIYGTLARFLVVPDFEDLSTAYLSTTTYDGEGDGFLAIRGGGLPSGNVPLNNELVAFEAVIDKTEGTSTSGRGRQIFFNASSVIDELPAASSGGPPSIVPGGGTRTVTSSIGRISPAERIVN